MVEFIEASLPTASTNSASALVLNISSRKTSSAEHRRYVAEALTQVMETCRQQIVVNNLTQELSVSLLDYTPELSEMFFDSLLNSFDILPNAHGLDQYRTSYQAAVRKLLTSSEFEKAIKYCCLIAVPRRSDWLITSPFSKIKGVTEVFAVREKDNELTGDFAKAVSNDYQLIDSKYSKLCEHGQQINEKSIEYLLSNSLEINQENVLLALRQQFPKKSALDSHLQLQSATSIAICREGRVSITKRLKALISRLFNGFVQELKQDRIYCEHLSRNFAGLVSNRFAVFAEQMTDGFIKSGKAYNKAFSNLIYT